MHTVKREEISFTLTLPQDRLQLKKNAIHKCMHKDKEETLNCKSSQN